MLVMKNNLFKIAGSVSSIFLFGVSNLAEAMMAKQFAREGSRFVTRTLHHVPMKHIVQPFVVPNYAMKQQMRFESSSEQKKEKQKKKSKKEILLPMKISLMI